jgi:hypothetical protein
MAHGRIHELIGAENRGDTAECVFDDWALEQCRFWRERVGLIQQ